MRLSRSARWKWSSAFAIPKGRRQRGNGLRDYAKTAYNTRVRSEEKGTVTLWAMRSGCGKGNGEKRSGHEPGTQVGWVRGT